MMQGTWVDHHLPYQLPGHYLTLESQEDLICNYTAKMSENNGLKIFSHFSKCPCSVFGIIINSLTTRFFIIIKEKNIYRN